MNTKQERIQLKNAEGFFIDVSLERENYQETYFEICQNFPEQLTSSKSAAPCPAEHVLVNSTYRLAEEKRSVSLPQAIRCTSVPA